MEEVRSKRTLISRSRAAGPRVATSFAAAMALAIPVSIAACSAATDGAESVSTSRAALDPTPCDLATATPGPTSTRTPIGLSVEVDNGVAKPLTVRAGQTFWLETIDLRASITASVDEGVNGLKTAGDFAELPWGNPRLEGVSPVVLPNADGTSTRRAFYDGATWMSSASYLLLEQVDAAGRTVGRPVTASIGKDSHARPTDSFYIRRLHALQWTYDCKSTTDCTGASSFGEEALVELRNALDKDQTFAIQPTTVALRLSWSLKSSSWTIPVTQDASPKYDYGFSIDIDPVTPPGAGGAYAPGTDVTFRTTLRDGAGNRLHPVGSMPTYNEAEFGSDDAGIQYYRAFFDPTTTFWRRKHRERNMIIEIMGPAQKIQTIRSFVELSSIFDPSGVQIIGTPERDGVFAAYATFPTANNLFAGGAGWDAPVSDTFTTHLPDNAEPGTYQVTMKARRVYMGQDIPFTRTVEIPVGTTQHTEATLPTGNCSSCHDGGGSLSTILHDNSKRSTCNGCHAPLGFEYDGPIYVRVHYIHWKSGRYDAPEDNCKSCHTSKESIQRTSKSACLSCHTTYPDSHIAQFGPITDSYVGGGRESFQQCTSSCHTTHPGSHL